MRIYVEENYVRAAQGGVGFAKAAGNYGAAMFPTAEAKRKGYDQVLWMDASEHKYVQECGTMNVFFIIGNKAITPGLEQGTILAGVTRNSVIQLLEEIGLDVEERLLSIDEIVEAYKAGNLREVFGTGTAVTISKIKELTYENFVMNFDTDKWEIAPEVKRRMDAIKNGLAEDRYGWMIKV
jgi:branched-chain amino acid aminotransferase